MEEEFQEDGPPIWNPWAPTRPIMPNFKFVKAGTSPIDSTDETSVSETDPESEFKFPEMSLAAMGYSTDDKNWKDSIRFTKTPLVELVKPLFENNENCTMTIQIGDEQFNVHRIILQCYSKYFNDKENAPHMTLPEDKVTPNAFIQIYKWMLETDFTLQRICILELFIAAEFLDIQRLVDQCWSFLNNELLFNEDTAIELYFETRDYKLENIKEMMLPRITMSFLVMVADVEFNTLTLSELSTLLNLTTIAVNSEIEILMIITYWLTSDWENRKQYMMQALELVHFKQLPPLYLLDLSQGVICPEIKPILTNPTISKLIVDTMAYKIQVRIGQIKPEQFKRLWIYDRTCEYHHFPECEGSNEVSYEKFLEYLKRIKEKGSRYWKTLELADEVAKDINKPCCQLYIPPEDRPSLEESYV